MRVFAARNADAALAGSLATAATGVAVDATGSFLFQQTYTARRLCLAHVTIRGNTKSGKNETGILFFS